MVKENKIPKEVLKELDINEIQDIQKDFEVTPVIEPSQIKLPIPKQLIDDLELHTNLKKGKKIKLYYDEGKKELQYKIWERV